MAEWFRSPTKGKVYGGVLWVPSGLPELCSLVLVDVLSS